MENVQNLSDFIDIVKNYFLPLEENDPLSDLYHTITEGSSQEDFYEGQGIFENTDLVFFKNQNHLPIAPSVDELSKEQLARHGDQIMLEVKTTYHHRYPNVDRLEKRTARAYLEIEEGEIYVDGEKVNGKPVKEILKH